MLTKNKKRFSLIERDEIVKRSINCLWSDYGKEGRAYLIEQRKISESCLKEFSIGYVHGKSQHQLKDRVIFPIYDASDHLIAIGSRSIKNQDGMPAYWHESYEKQLYVYGINITKKHIHEAKYAIVVEGQFDLLKLYCNGFKNVVAICGTQMSDVQVSVIQRYCDDIVLLLDVDKNEAGQKGVAKIVENSKVFPVFVDCSKFPSNFPLPLSLFNNTFNAGTRNLIVASLPENCDPDEFVDKYGANKLKEIIESKLHELKNSIS